MRIACSWCKKDLGEKPPLENKEVTHGICLTCLGKQMRKLDKEIAPTNAEMSERRN